MGCVCRSNSKRHSKDEPPAVWSDLGRIHSTGLQEPLGERGGLTVSVSGKMNHTTCLYCFRQHGWTPAYQRNRSPVMATLSQLCFLLTWTALGTSEGFWPYTRIPPNTDVLQVWDIVPCSHFHSAIWLMYQLQIQADHLPHFHGDVALVRKWQTGEVVLQQPGMGFSFLPWPNGFCITCKTLISHV